MIASVGRRAGSDGEPDPDGRERERAEQRVADDRPRLTCGTCPPRRAFFRSRSSSRSLQPLGEELADAGGGGVEEAAQAVGGL